MENKKSFILYADIIHTVEKLPDSDAGELFKHLLRYVNDLEPETENLLVQLTFEPIKQQLKRDLEKWQGSREKRAEAGRKGGNARAAKQKQAMLKELEANQANQADNVNVNVSDNVNGNVNDNVINPLKESVEDFIRWRKEIRKPMTQIAIKNLWLKVKKYPEQTAIAMLHQSIERSWAGVFEIDSNKKANGKQETRADKALGNIAVGGNEGLNEVTGIGSF